MLKFLSGQGVSHNLRVALKVAGIVTAGSICGYMSSLWMAEDQDSWYNADYMTEYKCDDNINKLIEQRQKPAVIYYYIAPRRAHHHFRSYFYKYSHRFPDNAIWTMVNIKQNLEDLRPAFKDIIFLFTEGRIQIRFPKKDLAIYQLQKDQLKLLKEEHGNRREVYDSPFKESDFREWLQKHGVIPGADPMQPLLNITQSVLFESP